MSAASSAEDDQQQLKRIGLQQRVARRRIRTAFTPWQLAAMEAQFRVQQYLVGDERCRFAGQLGLNQVK
jgi:hypothetical protein